jgi:hypothetical protein
MNLATNEFELNKWREAKAEAKAQLAKAAAVEIASTLQFCIYSLSSQPS